MMAAFGATSSTFSGFYRINTVNSSTQVLISSQSNSNTYGYQQGDSTANSATGGTATFILSNHLTWTLGTGVWQYYVCAERPGDSSFSLIGVTVPSTTAGQDVQFDDYGSPYNDNQIYPTYITSSLCNGGSAQNDPLTTTITNINGTTFTLANAASNNTSATKAIFDDAPGIIAAAQSVSFSSPTFKTGRIIIPPTGFNLPFVVNSYLKLPTNVSVVQMGNITAAETIELDGGVTWDGSQSNNGIPQFGYSATGGGAILNGSGAYPLIYDSKIGDLIQNITLQLGNNSNGGLIELDDASSVVRHNVQYTTSTGTGYLGHAIWYRGSGGSNPSKVLIDRSTFTMSPPNGGRASWSSHFYAAPIQNGSGGFVSGPSAQFWFTNVDMNDFGFEALANGSNWHFTDTVRQAGVAPFLWLIGSSAGNIDMDNVFLDTDTTGILSVATVNPISVLNVSVVGGNGTAADVGGFVSPITGSPLTNLKHYTAQDGLLPNASGFGTCNPTARGAGFALGNIQCSFDPLLFTGPNGYLFWPLATPTGQTATLAAGGSFGSDTIEFEITAVDANGQETVASAVTSSSPTSGTCPGSGNCSYTVNATPVPGAVSYNLYACSVNHTVGPQCPSVGNMTNETHVQLPVTVTTFTGANFGPPTITTAGITKITSSFINSPAFVISESSAPSGISSSGLLYEDSTTHLPTFNPNNAGAQTVARYTASLTGSDCANWSGTSGLLGDAGGKCGVYTITPTNGHCVQWTVSGGVTTLTDAGGGCTAGNGGMDTNMDNMANPTAMSQSLIPGAVNTVAAGSAALPFTNIFLGTVANEAASFNTSNLSTNRTINLPDATSTPVRDCPAVTNKFMTAEAVATGTCSQSFISASAATPPSYVADSGAVNAYVATLSPAIASYSAGLVVRFLPANANTTTNPTLNVNSVGAATITKFGTSALVANDLVTTQIAEVVYDGTDWELQNPNTVANVVTSSSTNTFTNKTFNQEGTGNVLTTVSVLPFNAALCNNSTPAPALSLPTTAAPTPNCLTGTNIQSATLDYDHSTAENAVYQTILPHTQTGNIDISLYWLVTSGGGSGAVKWTISTACAATGATFDTAYNSAQTVTTSVGSNNNVTESTQTSLTTTGCAVDDVMYIKIGRDVSDSFTGTARLMGGKVILRKTGN